MRFCVVVSEKDAAGRNIFCRLVEKGFQKASTGSPGSYSRGNVSLVRTEEDIVEPDDLDRIYAADLFIFASRHESKKRLPCLCVHSPGNWGEADFGGKRKMLCKAPALFLRDAYLQLKNNGLAYEVFQEATHHGPFLDKPCMFIEIGSSMAEWENALAGKMIADSIINITGSEKDVMLSGKTQQDLKIAFGIGGLHTMPKLSELTEKGYAFGHVCPKYNLHNLDKSLIQQAMAKTIPKADHVVLDWKGLGQEKHRILSILDDLGIGYEKIR